MGHAFLLQIRFLNYFLIHFNDNGGNKLLVEFQTTVDIILIYILLNYQGFFEPIKVKNRLCS